MRLIVDMQGEQSSVSRDQGIGRYTKSLVTALLRQGISHEIVLAFNGDSPVGA